MELSLLCDVRVFLFIYDNHHHNNHHTTASGGSSANPSGISDSAKIIHYQSDPRDDLTHLLKSNFNRTLFTNENVSYTLL